jgi:hypothetical protein
MVIINKILYNMKSIIQHEEYYTNIYIYYYYYK